MIDFYAESSNKQWLIEYDEGTFSNTDIYSRSISIRESINSGNELRFGGIEACSFSATLRNNGESLLGKWLTVKLECQGEQMIVGRYKVASETLSSDKSSRKIVAYDVMYDLMQENIAEWFSNYFSVIKAKTMKQFRSDLIYHFGLQQVSVNLCNDDMPVSATIVTEKLLGKTVLQAICEINGCFGHINREGKFEYIILKPIGEGLTPAVNLVPSLSLVPRTAENALQVPKGKYISVQSEDFKTAIIDKIQIRQDTDDIGGIYGDGDNCYIIENNFLCYGKTTSELQSIGQKILSVIGGIWYTPANVEAVGNLNLCVGDGIYLTTKHGTVMTYILDRTITASQSMRDRYYAKGKEKQAEKVNSVNESIINVVGKTNRLTRTVEELNSQINDEKYGLQSQITQNADNIKLIVKQSFEGNMITDASIGALESFPKGQYTELGIDVVYGKGFTVSGSEGLVGQLQLSATQYTLSFLMRSDNWQWTEPEVYLVDENGNETWIELVAYGVHYGWWTTSGTFTAPASGSYYIKFVESADMGIQFSDLMLSTGGLALDWTPNRVDEWSMISQTQDSISAKVEKTGGDASSFSWELLNDHFSLKSGNREVFKADANGINVNGYATIDYIQTNVLDTIDLKVENAVAGRIDAVNAEIQKLYANEATLGNLISQKIDASVVIANFATISSLNSVNAEIQKLYANEAQLGSLITNKIDANYISANVLNVARKDPYQGEMAIGNIRTGTLKIFDGRQYRSIGFSSGTISGRTQNYLSWS